MSVCVWAPLCILGSALRSVALKGRGARKGTKGWWVAGEKNYRQAHVWLLGLVFGFRLWGLQLTGLCCSCSRCRCRCLGRRRCPVVVYRTARWSLLFGVSHVRGLFFYHLLCTFLGPANRTLSLQLKRKMLAICCRSLSRLPYAIFPSLSAVSFPTFSYVPPLLLLLLLLPIYVLAWLKAQKKDEENSKLNFF